MLSLGQAGAWNWGCRRRAHFLVGARALTQATPPRAPSGLMFCCCWLEILNLSGHGSPPEFLDRPQGRCSGRFLGQVAQLHVT